MPWFLSSVVISPRRTRLYSLIEIKLIILAPCQLYLCCEAFVEYGHHLLSVFVPKRVFVLRYERLCCRCLV